MIPAFPTSKKDFQLCLKVTKRVWVAKHDVYPDNRLVFPEIEKPKDWSFVVIVFKLAISIGFCRELAENVWNKANLDSHMNGLPENLLEDITSKNPDIQEAAAKALADLLSQLEGNVINSIVKKLQNIYHDKLTVTNLFVAIKATHFVISFSKISHECLKRV